VKLIFYSAFVDGKLEAPRSLLREVHRLYLEPQYPEFSARTMWSLSNAFTSAFKKLDSVLQFKSTAKLGAFLRYSGDHAFSGLGESLRIKRRGPSCDDRALGPEPDFRTYGDLWKI
jgi:hypothetical protein